MDPRDSGRVTTSSFPARSIEAIALANLDSGRANRRTRPPRNLSWGSRCTSRANRLDQALDRPLPGARWSSTLGYAEAHFNARELRTVSSKMGRLQEAEASPTSHGDPITEKKFVLGALQPRQDLRELRAGLVQAVAQYRKLCRARLAVRATPTSIWGSCYYASSDIDRIDHESHPCSGAGAQHQGGRGSFSATPTCRSSIDGQPCGSRRTSTALRHRHRSRPMWTVVYSLGVFRWPHRVGTTRNRSSGSRRSWSIWKTRPKAMMSQDGARVSSNSMVEHTAESEGRIGRLSDRVEVPPAARAFHRFG